MIWNRRKRFATVLFALLNVLFMQLAVAAYVCPASLDQRASTQPTTMVEAGMPCAEAMVSAGDVEQPSLCAAHCKADAQSADKLQLPVLAVSACGGIDYPLLRVVQASMDPPAETSLLTRSTQPSVAVRHCCFRL